ncbi:Histone transcription regulator 3 [Dissophora ornata]|nr:Histone transcription regulator 3 [Dissophora ornata]
MPRAVHPAMQHALAHRMQIRFAVLNEEEQSRSREEESVEIQAEKCLGIYESAIRLLQKGQLEESKNMLKNLIDSDLFQNIDNDSEIAARGTPIRRLQYLVYTNYAYILEQVLDESSALQFYLKAIAFDNSDNSLWVKVGTIAAKEKKFKLARYSLECGLLQPRPDATDNSAESSILSDDVSDLDLTPTQWSCLETLCNVLYEIGDFVACEDYVQKALKISPYFQRGVELQNLIRSRLRDMQDDQNFDCTSLETPPASKIGAGANEIFLEDLSWLCLGEKLLEEYKSLLEAPEKEFYNQRLVVRTHKAEEEESEDVEMAEEPTKVEDLLDAVEAEAAVEETMILETKAVVEQSVQEPAEAIAGSVPITSDDVAEQHGDKEAADTEQTAAMKRKRKEVEERSGLRTSKRVRDKLEQFEETKRKREEEEQEILAKYRIVLSKFGMDIENAHISGTTPDSLKLEDVFPSGLSGLLITFNKHLERPNALVQASTIEHVQQQKTNHFAIFNLEKNEPTTDSFFEDDTALLDFINRTNERNSGIVEYLCEFVMVVMSGLTNLDSESNWQKRWPSGLQPILSSIIFMIEEQLLEYFHQESQPDDMSNEIEQRIQLELYLSICEMYLDEMVHAILHPFTVVSRKGRGARKVDAEHVAKLDRMFQRWLYLAGLGLETSPKYPTNNNIHSSTVSWIRAGALSKYDTKVDAGRIQERLGRLKTHQYVLDSARLFDEKDYRAVMTRLGPIFLKKVTANRSSQETVEIVESDIADTIGGSLSERLELMGLLYKSCEALENRSQQFHCITEMFVLVVETLVNTITDKSEATEVWFLFGQVGQTLYLLRETLQSTTLSDLLGSLETRMLQRLVCCVLAIARLGFVNVLHQDRLVDDDIKLSYPVLLKHRPHLEQFNLVLVRVWLVLLLLLPGWIQGDSSSAVSEDKDQIMTDPMLLNTQPLDVKAMNMDSETVKRVLSQPLTTNSSTPLGIYKCPLQELYMELIALVHDDLGVRGICGVDNNQLIKLALKISSPMQGPFYRKEENQCYYCFYGISLSVDGQYPIEHSTEPVDFDKKAATEFFPLLERSLSDRVLRGQVRGDLKDAVDRVEEALGAPPYETNSVLEMNRQIIDSYLASEINFAEAIQVNSKDCLPTMQQPPSSKLPSVYRRIYAIQGKIFLAQFRNKAKNNQFKPLEDLQHAIDQFRTDIHVNPNCWDSWYSLATCYAFLADENLVFSALDIKNNFSKITDLQKMAFHCFSQAVRLAPKRTYRSNSNGNVPRKSDSQAENEVKPSLIELSQESTGRERAASEDRGSETSADLSDKHGPMDIDIDVDQEWYQRQATFWFDFGNLIHGIMSRPMRMEAMHRTGETISDARGPTTIPIPEPTEEQVYKFAAFCFKRSLMLNDQNWRTPLMLGKCLEKLSGKPTQVLALYRMAADKVPHRNRQPSNEKIFDAAYKIISTLSKYLTDDKIKPSVVESIMSKTLTKSKLIATDGESFIFEPPKEYLHVLQSDPPSEDDIQKKEKLHAFRLLCEGLARIRHTDKRHWHHRPVYRQAWILYNVYHDVERAKTEMLGLFQIKSNLKTLVSSVWKPEFERSGKHFIYVGEYTKFLIVLAKETSDVETLNSLARKIRRAHGLLLDLKEIWELLYDSYLAVLADLVGPDPVLPVAEVIPRTEFREKAAIYEAKMFEQAAKLPGLAVLQRLCELKKLNEKMAAEGQMGRLLAVCYSKLFIEVGGAELYPKELVRQLSSNLEPYASSSGEVNGTNGVESRSHAADGQEESTISTKRGQATDEEDDQDDVRLKMAKLTTEAQAGANAATNTSPQLALAAASNGSVPLIVVEDNDSRDGEQETKGNDRRTAADQSQSRSQASSSTDMTVPSGADTPSSPAPSVNAGDGDNGSSMDVEPDIEDWKTRKKISASELASRATVMCKAPPPLLKAPQSLQSKLAGPDSQPAPEGTPAAAQGPSDESDDTVMGSEVLSQDRKEEAVDGPGAEMEAEAETATTVSEAPDTDLGSATVIQDQEEEESTTAEEPMSTEAVAAASDASDKAMNVGDNADPECEDGGKASDLSQKAGDHDGSGSPTESRTRVMPKRLSTRRNSKIEEDVTMH